MFLQMKYLICLSVCTLYDDVYSFRSLGKSYVGKGEYSTSGRDGMAKFFFCLLLFSYPLLSLLWRRSYPIFIEEVLWLFTGIFALSIIFSLVSSHIRPVILNLLTTILILLSFMVQFNLLVEGIVVCIAISAVMLYIFGQHFHLNAVPILIALLIGAYFDSRHEPIEDRTGENIELLNTELAPVVHIVLDGFIGIGGLPNYPASDVIRQEILSFFSSNNFHLFSHAYSRHGVTGSSLYTAMNFRNDGEDIFTLEAVGRRKHIMQENRIFTYAERLGYRLKVYQTSHLDFCQSNPNNLDRCWQYDHPNINSVLASDNTTLRARALVHILVNQSRLLSKLQPDTGGALLISIAAHDPRITKEIEQDVSSNGPGYYFFAHALIPHEPYVYQADCSINYETEEVVRNARFRNEPVLSDDVYEYRYGLYFGQTECALKNLQLIIDGMKQAGLYDRAIIILHGDHGSRISRYVANARNRELLSPQDYRSTFSTLFAVKYPGSHFTVDPRPLPLSYLLEEFLSALPSYTQNGKMLPNFALPEGAESKRNIPYVFLPGAYPQLRVDIDIFAD
jgi:hypothetical protein